MQTGRPSRRLLRRLCRHRLRLAVILFVLAFLVVQFLQLSSLFSLQYGPMLMKWLSPRPATPTDAKSIVLHDGEARRSRKRQLDVMLSDASCHNTQQGWDLVTDDRGRLCSRMQVHDGMEGMAGCCPEPEVTGYEQYTCQGCDELYNCCGQYEVCVACCLDPQRRHMLEAILDSGSHPAYFTTSTPFELCRFKCRTSSGSTIHENTYRSGQHHCFGVLNPPLRQDPHPVAAPYLEPSSVEPFTPSGGAARRSGGAVLEELGAARHGDASSARVPQRYQAVSLDPYLKGIGAPFWPPRGEAAADKDSPPDSKEGNL